MKTRYLPIAAVLPLCLILFVYKLHRDKAKATTANPQITFINGSTNNKLEILDWGGEGRNILFLAGLGNSAHIYDDFAPKFTNSFHVYGITRRGFGASTQTATGYDITTWTKDILAAIDSLHLQKVILIGHSIAGEEISKFASTYPNRVEKIVYLDAAYDRMNLINFMTQHPPPAPPKATAKDSSSIAQLNNYNKKVVGVSFPEDEVKQQYVFSKTGKLVKDVTPDSLAYAILSQLEHPAYAKITCPALALYSKLDVVQHSVSYYASLDSIGKKQANAFFAAFVMYQNEEEARFKKEILHGTVKEVVGANHYMFISNKVVVEEILKEWL
jgi:non-heme chloroperoxidase